MPFAGIAFLWFIGVVRDRLGGHEDKLFATVFLGSGLLFLAMLFASAALAGGTMLAYGEAQPTLRAQPRVRPRACRHLCDVEHLRDQDGRTVHDLQSCTLFLRIGVTPRWMALLGYALALLLLLTINHVAGSSLVFPLWILLISIYILIENYRRGPGVAMPGPDTTMSGSDTAVSSPAK